jgi:signal transduction histidine kinase
MSLRVDLRTLLGAAIGVIGVLVPLVLGRASENAPPLTVVAVLTIALVGLGLGAAASLYAYISASVAMILVNAFPTTVGTPLPELIRIGAFVVGCPFVILLALRADRQRAALLEARDHGAAMRERLEVERQHADEVRREVDSAGRRADADRARLAEVAEVIPEPLIVYDADGRGTYANRAALRLFGRSFVERDLAQWGNSADPRDEHGEPLSGAEFPQVAAQTRALRRRMIVRLPMSGRDLLIDVEGTPIPGGGAVLLLRDVGREEAERRRLSQFASFVAHELRNPLAVARARIELAQREARAPERSATHGGRALESVEAAIAVLERLEMYSRAESGTVEAVNEPFDVRQAVNAATERLRTRGSDRSVRVRVRGRPRALGDQRLAEQAITNLLTNADRYSEANAPIQVNLEPGADGVVLRVADAGPGIADEVAERLFKDRVDAGRGLGLGLFLTNAMMAAQGGSVVLEQRRPTAIFVLRWPSAAMVRARKARRPIESPVAADDGIDQTDGVALEPGVVGPEEVRDGKSVNADAAGVVATDRS